MQTHKVVCKTMCNLICSIIHSLALQPPAQSLVSQPPSHQLLLLAGSPRTSGPVLHRQRTSLCSASRTRGGWQEAGPDGRRFRSTWYRFELFMPKWTPYAQRLGQRN